MALVEAMLVESEHDHYCTIEDVPEISVVQLRLVLFVQVVVLELVFAVMTVE